MAGRCTVPASDVGIVGSGVGVGECTTIGLHASEAGSPVAMNVGPGNVAAVLNVGNVGATDATVGNV